MTKISLQNIDNLQNESTVVSAINNNNAFTRAVMDNTLSRDGTAPNQMNTPLDMNSKKIINLIDATTDQEPVTFGQFNNTIGALNAGGVVTGSYVTLSPNSTLTQERILSAGNNISVIDSGPGTPSVPGTVTVGVSDDDLNAVAALSTTGLIARTGAGTAALGTPASGTLTNTTGLPISTGVSGLGAGVATFLATPSSANLATAMTDETGSGANVFATSPTLVTPILGTPTSGTLTNCTGLPLSGHTNQAAYTIVAI